MEGPMESAPYRPPWVDPSLLKHIPLFTASVMLGQKMPEKARGLVRPSVIPVRTPLRSTRATLHPRGRLMPEWLMRHA